MSSCGWCQIAHLPSHNVSRVRFAHFETASRFPPASCRPDARDEIGQFEIYDVLLSPCRKGLHAVALCFCLLMLIMLIMQINSSLLLMRTCQAIAWMAQQLSSTGGRERPQRCWATRTTGVPDVSFSVKNFTP